MAQLSEKFILWGQRYQAMLVALMALVASMAFGFSLARDIPPILLIIAPIVLVIAVAIFLKPEFGAIIMLGLIWGFISEIAGKYYGIPSITKPLVGLLLVAMVVRRFTGQRKPLVYDPTTWWMVAYWLVIALGLWYAQNPDRVMFLVTDFAKDILLYLIVINLIVSIKSFERVMWLLLAIGAVLGTMTVFQELTQTYSNNYGGLARIKMAFIADEIGSRPRAAGTTGEPLVYGQQLLVLIPIALWGCLYGRNLAVRVAAGYTAVACVAGIVLSFSRSSYIAMGAVLLLFALHIRLNPRYLLLIGLLLAGLWRVAPPEFTARLGTLENLLPGSEEGVNSEGSFRGRSSEMMMAVYMFSDYPLLGVGAGNFRQLYPEYIREYGSPVKDEQRNAHNFYLEVAAEHGLLGLIAWGGILVMALNRLHLAEQLFMRAQNRRMAELAVALRCGFLGYLISAIFYHGGYPSYLWIQIGIAVALAVIAQRYVAQQAPALAPAAQVA